MRVSIIVPDKTVAVDGIGFPVDDLSFIDPSIQAVQWEGTSGHVEFVYDENGKKPLNKKITDFSPYEQAVASWQVKKDAYDALFIPTVVAGE